MNRISIHIESDGLTVHQSNLLAAFASSLQSEANDEPDFTKFREKVKAESEVQTAAESKLEKVQDEPTPQEKAAATKKANAAKAAAAKAEKEAAEAAAALEVNEPEEVDPMTEEADDDIMGGDTSAVTLVEIRSLTQEKVKANKPALVELLTKLGATGISDLDPKHYGTFYAFLQKLK
jgi:hypothetical protein